MPIRGVQLRNLLLKLALFSTLKIKVNAGLKDQQLVYFAQGLIALRNWHIGKYKAFNYDHRASCRP